MGSVLNMLSCLVLVILATGQSVAGLPVYAAGKRLCWSYELVDKFLAQVISVNTNAAPEQQKRRFSGFFSHAHAKRAGLGEESTGLKDKLLCWKYEDVDGFLNLLDRYYTIQPEKRNEAFKRSLIGATSDYNYNGLADYLSGANYKRD